MKIKVQRLTKVWIEETYNVENLSNEIIDKIIDYELDDTLECLDVKTLYDTQEDLGPIEFYDENYKLLNKQE